MNPLAEKNINLIAATFTGLLICTNLIAYWPGLSGNFWFDDFAALEGLGIYSTAGGGLDGLKAFLFSGTSSFIGRPLALLTFLLDGQSWPADPYPFKYTNVLLHILNSIVVFGFLFSLSQLLQQTRRQALSIAILGAAAWSLHPIQVSTVLYVVQRMTELSALFIFLAMWSYIHGRSILRHRPGSGYYWMSGSLLVLGPLAILCKENGALIPVLILVLEATLLSHLPRPKHWRYWAIPALGLPCIIILSYLGNIVLHHNEYYLARDFTLYERVLSQGRIIVDYLSTLLFPLQTPTLIHDDLTVPEGLLKPWSTLPSLLLVVALLAHAIRRRTIQPVLSFAILWYFSAQLLESTVIPLELYFEHRNYIPLLGPALAFGYYGQKLIARRQKVYTGTIVLIMLLLPMLTWTHSNTWAGDVSLTQAWLEEHPTSIRAHFIHSYHLLAKGKPAEALAVAESAYQLEKNHLGSQLNYAGLACLNNRLEKEEYISLIRDTGVKQFDTETFPALVQLYDFIMKGACRQISIDGLNRIVSALLKNPSSTKQSWVTISLYKMSARVNLKLKLFEPTVYAYQRVFELSPSVSTALELASFYGSINHLEMAERYIDAARLLDDKRNSLLPSEAGMIEKAKTRIMSAAEKS